MRISYRTALLGSVALNACLLIIGSALRQPAQLQGMFTSNKVSMRRGPVLSGRARALRAHADRSMNCLIVQNKGGGHGEIGYHLASQLASEGHSVTLLGDPATKKESLPFARYGDLLSKGVTVKYGNPCDPTTFSTLGDFDAVFDNAAKSKDSCKTVADLAKNVWKVKNYAYVSSAGMYKPGYTFPMSESLPVKDTAGQKEVEDYLREIGLPWSSFRPQYIYGPLTNKRDYLDYFFDRVTRGVPVPVAGSGQQLVTLTHAADVASMLASVIDAGEKSHGQVFNCATDQLITVDDLIKLCGKIAGNPNPRIVHYDPKSVQLEKKAFPFRDNNFFVAPDKAKVRLGWQCKHTLERELVKYFEGYKALGKLDKDIKFSVDEAIFGQVPMHA